jgi:hypothetical protein
MNMNEIFAKERERDVQLTRASAADIWNRARRDELIERYAREDPRILDRVFGIVELLAVDVAAAALILPAGGIVAAALGAAVVHTAGTLVSAAREVSS